MEIHDCIVEDNKIQYKKAYIFQRLSKDPNVGAIVAWFTCQYWTENIIIVQDDIFETTPLLHASLTISIKLLSGKYMW